jgi:hypothetical protein
LNTVYRRTLWRAADVLGGKDQPRAYLRVPMHRLEAWMADEQPPMDVFLRTVDLLSGRDTIRLLQRTVWLRQSSEQILRESQRVLDESARIRHASAGSRRAHAVNDFFARSFALADRREVMESALEAAIAATDADKGNLQLAGADGLRIVAQRGFEQPFLEYFAAVADGSCACGRALGSGQRVVVSDVASHEIFAGTQAGEVMKSAGARACQSTPLIASSGWILGMISTHFGRPTTPSDEALERLERIAHRTAAWLEAATTPGR